ncbi:hypothetical protein [Sporichthya sp.]|uniref:hypothetical protein n=1 Tax=Sporichthya sp. TaxID=65475 RepID=UPI0017FE826F|nr:hypothetical protein [Sporichthya sp.]MBA3742842.1 hypothetical protein [Sporichthya sp.]
MAPALADRWVVFGTEIPNPAQIRDARFAGAVYACRAAEARALMRGTGLEPVTAGGRAFSALACIQYIKLWDGETRVLAVALDGGPVAAPTAMTIPLPVWSVRVDGANQGELLHGPFPLRAEGFRIRPGGARVALGEHRMSDLARRLGMTGSALYTMSARKISGSLGDFDVVG